MWIAVAVALLAGIGGVPLALGWFSKRRPEDRMR
jgi:hypothetical protein